MANFQPYEEGGITGKTKQQGLIDILQGAGGTAGSGQAPPMQADGPAPVTPPAAAPAEDYTQLGKYANKLQGYDMNKFADPNRSEKYKIGAVQSHFDPTQGVTPEYLAALNGLGIAKFSGQGDQLSVENSQNDPRFGHGGAGDVVKGLKGQNADTAWQPWFVDEGGQQQQAQGGGGMPSFAGSNINGMLQSDAQGNIQQALAGLQQPGMLRQLIAALRGGQ